MLVLTDCLWYIACRDGLLAWWGGLLPSLILVFNPAINFMIYEGQKRNILPILSSWVRKMRSCMFCLPVRTYAAFVKCVNIERSTSNGSITVYCLIMHNDNYKNDNNNNKKKKNSSNSYKMLQVELQKL